jgi:hypothetical protein
MSKTLMLRWWYYMNDRVVTADSPVDLIASLCNKKGMWALQ